jgi:hypothetical protein
MGRHCPSNRAKEIKHHKKSAWNQAKRKAYNGKNHKFKKQCTNEDERHPNKVDQETPQTEHLCQIIFGSQIAGF